MNNESVEYSGNSAPFHVGVGLMLFNKGMSFIVNSVFNDDNESRGLKINDENALKIKLLKEIQKKYNNRIHHYQLGYKDISDNHISKLNIIKYRFVKDFQSEDPSGDFNLFPNAFVCKKCGHYVINQKLYQFNPKKCALCQEGEYEQMSLLRFCEECGSIDKFFYKCKEHGVDNIILDRADKDNLFTWKFKCKKCNQELDVFKFKCEHKVTPYSEPIKKGECKFKPMTIRESGIFSPVVVSNIDLPKTISIRDSKIDKELIMLGFYFNFFKDIEQIKDIDSVYRILNSYESDKKDGFEITEQKEKVVTKIYELINLLNQYKQKIPEDVLKQFNELSILKGTAGNLGSASEFVEYIKTHEKDELIINERIEVYRKICKEFNLKQVNYLSNVKVINSLIGIVKGINKFWDKDENNEQKIPPHFELFWKNLNYELTRPYIKYVDRDNESFSVYSYPFETEGILIELEPEKICSWLYENKLIDEKMDSKKASEYLLSISEAKNGETYNATYTLLHTLSHILIKKIHLYTGLGIESCGEKIFVNGGAIFLYSNNNLNIGALQFLIEHNMFNEGGIFNSLKEEIRDCSFDPLCMDERGACFSCLYVPEFVCCNFNLNLDRNVFVGTGKRKLVKSFWS